jgi:hypothetical protein
MWWVWWASALRVIETTFGETDEASIELDVLKGPTPTLSIKGPMSPAIPWRDRYQDFVVCVEKRLPSQGSVPGLISSSSVGSAVVLVVCLKCSFLNVDPC